MWQDDRKWEGVGILYDSRGTAYLKVEMKSVENIWLPPTPLPPLAHMIWVRRNRFKWEGEADSYWRTRFQLRLKDRGIFREEVESEQHFVTHRKIVVTQEGKVEESRKEEKGGQWAGGKTDRVVWHTSTAGAGQGSHVSENDWGWQEWWAWFVLMAVQLSRELILTLQWFNAWASLDSMVT